MRGQPAEKRTRVHPDELDAILKKIGWSARHLAEVLECHRNLPTAWLFGRAKVPPLIALWLRQLAACHEAHPAPKHWRTRTMA